MESSQVNRLYNLKDLQCLDLYAETLSVSDKIKSSKRCALQHYLIHPLISFGQDLTKSINNAHLGSKSDLESLQIIQKSYHWDLNLKDVFAKKFDALILTGTDKKIEWVSNGHSFLTGYTASEVIGNRPSMFQGEGSSWEAIQKLSNGLKTEQPFNTEILNYRKDGSSYVCEIEILPLRNKKNKLTHFLAIENFRG
jgi:PAS domain S-box-containing protein